MRIKVYKIAAYLLLVSLGFANNLNAQVPVPPPASPEALPLPPLPPMEIKIDLEKWEEFGKKLETSMVDFSQKLKERLKDFEIKFKDTDKNFKIEVQIPEIPAIPEIPTIPEIPIIINGESYQTGALENAIEKVKKLTKSYSTGTSNVLSIDHNYGRITVNTWEKNEVKVDVEIKAYAEDEDSAQRLLDGVTITNGKTGNQITFKTNIENNNKSNSWMTMSYWNGNSNNKQKVDVFYTVYMPAKTAINLKTNYTNVILPNLDGAVTVNMNYGDLTSDNLGGKTNLRTNYVEVNLGKIEDAILSANYGSIKVSEAKNVNANLNYCAIDLSKLNESAVLKTNYYGIKIGTLSKEFKSLNINSNYSPIILGFEGSESFNFDVNTMNAGFRYNEAKTKITFKTPGDEAKDRNSNKQYKGFYGKASSDANIVIKANYGSVKFE